MEGDEDAAAAQPSGGRRPPSPRCCVLANLRQLTRQPPSSANRPVHGGFKLRRIVHTRRLQLPHYKSHWDLDFRKPTNQITTEVEVSVEVDGGTALGKLLEPQDCVLHFLPVTVNFSQIRSFFRSELPDKICVPHTGKDTDLDKPIQSVFPMLDENLSDPNYITSRAILSTRNEYVDRINMKMINLFRGEEMVYHSFDRAEDDPHSYYPAEFLNNLTPNGLPPHVLKLKINCPVILLRNIDPANGLCNGTRLVVRGFQKNAIDAEIVLGQHAGKRVFLPRIPLCPSDDDMFPFRFKRKQFPVRLSFAMTINKAQGQTIPNVGVYLPDPMFSHGQLYVALSRATARSNIKILAVADKEKDKLLKSRKTRGTFTKNIVYREVLTT